MGAHLGPRPLGNTPYVPPFPRDPFFNAVSLLLHGDGTNGAQNNTFLDSSTNNFTITRNGNTTQGTNTPFSQDAGYWSNYFNGTTDYLRTSLINLSADFTIECWIYPLTTADQFVASSASNNVQIFRLNIGGAVGSLSWYNGATATATNVITLNTWQHVAISRTGSTVKMFVNGVVVDTTTNTGGFEAGCIGKLYVSSGFFNGYVSNFRVVTGTGIYTSNFTPSTTPLTAISGTSLLTCQSNNFKDNSSNNFTITQNGDTSVQPFSPFAPTSAYSTSVNGGSMYFDGTGDYLSLANNTALNLESGDFTIEAWFYTTSSSTTRPIVNRTNGNAGARTDIQFWIGIISGNLYISPYSGATDYSMTFLSVPLNQWNHCALVRTGNTFYAYLNGVRNAITQTIAGNLNNGTWQTWIGAYQESSAFSYQLGYIGDVRIIKGTALYTGSTYTVPTAPLTSIANTQLLLSGTNAGIFDSAGDNNLETVGNAQVSTSVVKYGTGSMSFDGTGDYLSFPSTPNLNLSTGNFTVECWFYQNAFVGGSYLFGISGASSAFAQAAIATNGSGAFYFLCADNATNNWISASTGGSYTSNTWNHLAGVRNGNTFTLYLNGTSVLTYTSSATLVNTSTYNRNVIGAATSFGSQINGYIDDLRVTKGVARYTADFTPPTAAFLDQ